MISIIVNKKLMSYWKLTQSSLVVLALSEQLNGFRAKSTFRL